MKKILLSCASAFGTVVGFAEEPTISNPTDILTNAQNTLSGLVTAALPIAGALVLSGLAIWGVMRLLPLIKRAFGVGTGR